MTEAKDADFVIAGWFVEPSTLRIRRQQDEVKLEPKVMAVLEYLAARPGQVVSRQELEDSVWAGTVVSYDAISNAIIKLRKAFGDDAQDPKIIETIPKAGYRLIAAVEGNQSRAPAMDANTDTSRKPVFEAGSGEPAHRSGWKIGLVQAVAFLLLVTVISILFKPWSSDVEPASADRMAFALPEKPSIAVLPFTNMSADQEQEYFADGMTEDLITDLSKISGLFVVARNSVFTYKNRAVKVGQIAEELGVRYVLEGSARRSGEQVRINAQLIDALNGGHVWAERYDGELIDIFALQDQITRSIVREIASSLDLGDESKSFSSQAVNVAAYDLYLKGWGHYRAGSPEDYGRAVEYYRQALAIDPEFARARAALAGALLDIHQKRWSWKSLDVVDYQSFDQARLALESSKQMPVALTHQVASEFYAFYDGNARRALLEADKAIKLNPNDPAGHLASAYALLKDGRLAEADIAMRTAMRLDPHYPPKYLLRLGLIQYHREQYIEAVESLQKAISSNPDDDWMYLYLAASYGMLQMPEKGREALARADALRAKNGWGRITLLALSNAYWGWLGDIGKLKEGLRAIDAPVGGEWYGLISLQIDFEPPEVDGATTIDVRQAHDLHQRGVVFIDTSFQWVQNRIPDSVFLEIWKGEGYRFNENSLRRYANLDDEIVVYSSEAKNQNVGRDAAMGAAIAVSRGFTRVYYFPGGLDAWKEAGYPVDTPR